MPSVDVQAEGVTILLNEEAQELAREARIPSGCTVGGIAVPGACVGKDWGHYGLILVGMVVPEIPATAPWQWITATFENGRTDILHLWLRLVYYIGMDARLEAVWSPQLGQEVQALINFELVRTQEEYDRFWRAKALLDCVPRRIGRPSGSSAYAEEEFCRRYPEAYATVAQRGHPPSREDVACELGITARTLGTYRKTFGLSWPP